ncbi:HNH endonuclease family protein [Alloscardovia venturai]|uniref:HNH endonuclease family protein n=1 Tax=Alloscardovia venturai TaxID=1769421 RepID=A0ABW2Y7A2_9BIFI
MTKGKRNRLTYRSKSTRSVWNVLVSAAVFLGVIIGLALPYFSKTIARTTGSYTATGDAAQTLQTLQVVDNPHPQGHYNRDDFGFRETDTDGDGCDVREDVLARDLQDVKYKWPSTCKVRSGVLHDPYTGTTINFVRGKNTSSAVQIDHVVALRNAWRSGAYKWDHAKKVQYANDMYNLLAVDGPANQNKGDGSADQWIPDNKSYACAYVARQIGVKARYNLTVTTNEKDAMMLILHGCSGQAVPQQ